MQYLTIAYMTNRKEPHIEWFLDSLMSPPQTRALGEVTYQLIVVDFWKYERDGKFIDLLGKHRALHVATKPNVWQGKHRLTKEDYFAASSARNTAICHAAGNWICFADDLSVLTPKWMERVMEAMKGGYIALGAYKKVKNLVVENGEIKSCDEFPGGIDSRLQKVSGPGPHNCDGGWMFGCSVAAPVEAFLKINGFDEDCDSLGSEDYIAGIMLEKQGYTLKYDPQMMTYESEEHHHLEKPFKRTDKGVSPNDKSHAILHMVRDGGRHVAPNYFGEGGIRALRQRVLAGEPFPICQVPQHCWFDSQPISEM